MKEMDAQIQLLSADQQRLLKSLACEVCGVFDVENTKARNHVYCQECLGRALFWSAEQAYFASLEKAAYERVRKENAEKCSTSSPKSE